MISKVFADLKKMFFYCFTNIFVISLFRSTALLRIPQVVFSWVLLGQKERLIISTILV
jgi:hypothetical protein